MKLIAQFIFVFTAWFAVQRPVNAAPVIANDGTTTANLVKLSNTIEVGEAVASLSSITGVLIASQVSFVDGLVPLRNVWFARDLSSTGGVYTVWAYFKPDQAEAVNRGGVMGWLNLNSKQGIGFQVVPGGDAPSFQVAVVDFTATTGDANENLANLFGLDGAPATGDFASAWSGLGTYNPTNFARLQLEFSAPTAADQIALTNQATAHIKAQAFELIDDLDVAVGRTIELLTTLPMPAGTDHRIGYYAYWASIISEGATIGQLDNLVFNGGFAVPPNALPTVSITSPANGASFDIADAIQVEAAAADSDGSITMVEFFAGPTLIGATNGPFTISWSPAVPGPYSLTVRATDDRGGTATSTNLVNVTITGVPGEGPSLQIELSNDNATVSWAARFTDYRLQSNSESSPTGWVEETTGADNRLTVPITDAPRFYRLKR